LPVGVCSEYFNSGYSWADIFFLFNLLTRWFPLVAKYLPLQKINPANSNVTIVVVDATNYEQVKGLAAQSRVLISFVGPYRKFGEPVVRACVEAGCHYVDTTGEPPFVQEIIEKYHEEAQKKKLMLLPGWFALLPLLCSMLINR